MPDTPLASRLRSHLEAGAPFRPGDPVLVACSGGLDSVSLLHLLRFPLADWRLRLGVAHFDHGMRAGSRADADWVRGVCRAWDVPVVIERAAPPPRSEADARRARYAFLRRAASDDEWILTAHHADDQAETLLFRMVRGTGPGGLRGIRARWGRVVRPLLPFRRAELDDYARSVHLGFRVDPTNRDLRFARNRIRHRVMPELERVRPGAVRALARLARHAEDVERAWRGALERLEREVVLESDGRGATLARAVLRSYHPHLRARVLRHLLRRYGSTPDRAGTHAALEFISSGHSGGGIDLSGGVRLERSFDRIRIERGGPSAPGIAPDRPLVIGTPGPAAGIAAVGGRSLRVAWRPAESAPSGSGPDDRVFRASVRLPLTLRGWRPGDRIRLAYGTKKLKKLFAERKLDRRERARVPVLVDAAGRIVWVVGVARAAGAHDHGSGGALEIRVADAEQR